MVKEKKGKKGNREEDLGDDLDSGVKNKPEEMSKSKKKERRKRNDDWEDDVASEIASLAPEEKINNKEQVEEDQQNEQKKPKKKTRGKAADNDDSGETERSNQLNAEDVVDFASAKKNLSASSSIENDLPQASSKGTKAAKGKKGKKGAALNDDDDEEFATINSKLSRQDPENSDSRTKSSKKTVKPKSMFELLADEGSDVDMNLDSDTESKDVAEEEAVTVTEPVGKETEKKKGKKSKKEMKKKDEDEELERMLAEIELGDKKKTKVKHKEEVQEVEEKGITVVTEIPEEEEEEKPRKKGKKKKDEAKTAVKESSETADAQDAEGEKNDEDADESTIKTAAQKKKDKKEKERQKKLAQKVQQAKTKPKEVSPDVEAKPEEKTEVAVNEPAEKVSTAESKLDDNEEGDDSKKKTDKKKKKTEKDKGEKEKKGPGKKQILAMQEALKKLKEEEERLRLEEEAKQKAAEEAEILRQEKIRLEQERKEKKKQKEKEKRDRLKAEGKLLSQSQKMQRARAAAMLESLRAQGLDVPKIGEKKERAPRPGDRIRPKKTKQDQSEADDTKESTPESVTDTNQVEEMAEIIEETKEEQPEVSELSDHNSEESVKDAWDEDSGGEDEETTSEAKMDVDIDGDTELKKESEEEESSESSSGEESSSDSEDDSEESEAEEHEHEHKRPNENLQERVYNRIMKRREENEKNRNTEKLRSPVVCVLGHVDTGKTKILDKIRHTHVQDSEAGGITQQIGATMVPLDAIKEQARMVKGFNNITLKIPGLLIIDTPGHESFSNLRSRGSSLCDIAILVVDIMHGIEPQTLESINLLKQKKTPFVVALNKVDRLYDWKTFKNRDIQDTLKAQNRNTMMEFEERVKIVVLQFAEQGLNATLCYDNKDPRTFISLVPTSALTGDGMGNLMSLIVDLTQSMMAKRIAYSDELQATVLEVKAIPGLGTTIDVILVNGKMRETDTLILAGIDGPLVTQIRSLLMPQPLKELRVKNPYLEYKEVEAAQGVKIAGKDLEKAIAGLNVLIANHADEVEFCKEEVAKELQAAMSSIKLAERGVYVQASTLGSLEALLEFLSTSKIPYSGIRIGPVVKKDVMKASIMLEHDNQYAVILAFDVKIERDAQELADSLGVKIFSADIIYHLFDKFTAYRDELRQKKRDQFKHIAVFPCRLRILPQFIFNTRDPIVVGVSVEAGVVREGTPLCVPSKENLEIGIVTTIEVNHKPMESARKGQEVCLKIDPIPGEAPKLYGRHFDYNDQLVSKISRQSIDACKDYFRDDLQKTDWQLMVELKKMFKIM